MQVVFSQLKVPVDASKALLKALCNLCLAEDKQFFLTTMQISKEVSLGDTEKSCLQSLISACSYQKSIDSECRYCPYKMFMLPI